MAGVSGVRGITGSGLDSSVASAYAAAYAGRAGAGSILVARDPRASGDMLKEAVVSTLIANGRDVIDLGIVPTPTLLMNTALLNAAGGIMITASHNPEEWNGLKFADPGGRYLAPEDSLALIADVAAGVTYEKACGAGAEGEGQIRTDKKAMNRHIELVSRASGVDTSAISGSGIRAAVDGCGGAAAEILPHFLESFGVETCCIYCNPDGSFPRPPEPVPEALSDLCRLVVEEGVDIGFALDPDGDRLALVGPAGIPLGEEATLALAARRVLATVKGPVVTNLSTSRMLDDVAAEAGVTVARTPVGEINVVEGMLIEGAVIGGEGNGGVIHPEVVLGRDALTGAALIISAMATDEVDLPTLRSGIPEYAMLKERYALPTDGLDGLKLRLGDLQQDQVEARADDRDGLRLDWIDRWIHIRPSNTEPIVRLIAEAPAMEEAVELAREMSSKLDLRRE